jgi:alcohol dehydrogenase
VLAAVASRYGTPYVVRVLEIPSPTPGPGEVRVRVRAASLNPLDSKLRTGALRPFMRLSFPVVLGFDLAGEIDVVGPDVRRFAAGQRVYGRTDRKTGGTHAQLAVVAESVLDSIPEGLPFEQAAALPLTALTALQALRDEAQLRSGQRLLVNGAAGGVGVAAIQIGKAMGAVVTGVTGPQSGAMVARLGAARVIDYTRDDLSPSTGRYDAILDAVANLPWRSAERLLEERGVYMTTGFSVRLAARGAWRRLWRRVRQKRQIRVIVSRADGDLMRALSGFVSRGHVEAVIDSVWPLDRIADAYARLETGHAHGKVVLIIP